MMAIQNTTDSLAPVEAELQALLQPIRPSKKFVQTVRSRIHISSPILIRTKTPRVRRFLLAMGGVLSVSLLVITGVRAIFYLVNRYRM